jgi:hypothetical protein
MPGRSKTLSVPYFSQPTDNTCQSTVLKMFATYLEQNVVFQSTGAADRQILDIWKDINQSEGRPSKLRNAHDNMRWWLQNHFPSLRFEYSNTNQEDRAVEGIVRYIDAGFPVLVSVSHARVPGHIILVVGYENHIPMASSMDFNLVVHDPYGQFDPTLLSKLFGKRRFEGGMSLMGGGERGPGQYNKLPLQSTSRQRAGDSQRGTWYLLSAVRS